jgi:hypothetical protein
MIDEAMFYAEWEALAGRFGKGADATQAAAFYDFLTDRMDTEDFVAAARTLWANARWFPRPVDFLLVSTAADWEGVLECMELSGKKEAWHEQYALLPQRVRDACLALGGIPHLKYLHDKDSIRAKTEWEKAVEQATAGEVLRLEAGVQRSRLSGKPEVHTLSRVNAGAALPALRHTGADEEG